MANASKGTGGLVPTPPNRGVVLAVERLSVTFSTGRGTVCAVDDVAFSAWQGQVLAIVGESGCGKSAMAMAIPGLLPETARVTGSALLDGQELIGMGEAGLNMVRGPSLSVVFQDPTTALNPVLRVGKQVEEVLRAHVGMTKAAAKERVVELFHRVGIPEPELRAREYPHQLSGGMRQRVVIAIAIACEPRVIVADEPTTALDVTVQATILEILRSLAADLQSAVLLITHDLGVVADAADEVVVMYAGRIVERAPTDEIFAHSAHPYTRALLAATPVPGASHHARLAEIPGVVPSLSSPAQSCSFAKRCDRALEICESTRPELQPLSDVHSVSCFNPWPEVRDQFD